MTEDEYWAGLSGTVYAATIGGLVATDTDLAADAIAKIAAYQADARVRWHVDADDITPQIEISTQGYLWVFLDRDDLMRMLTALDEKEATR